MTEPVRLLRTEEACRVLGVGRTTLYDLAKTGQIRRTKVAGCTRWHPRELERYIDRRTR